MGWAKSSTSRVGGEPAIEEAIDPAVERWIVERVHAEMHAALLGTGKFQTLGSHPRPDLLHLECDLGVEREAEGIGPAAEPLHRITLVGRQELAAIGNGNAFAMPLVDLYRCLEPLASRFSRLDVDISHFDVPLGMRRDLAAGGARQELCAETQAEVGHTRLDHLGYPIELALDAIEGTAIVGRHRPAEDHHTGIFRHVFRQLAAEVGAKAVQLVAALLEEDADTAGSGMFLMDYNRYFFGLFSRYCHGFARYAWVVASTRRTRGRGTKWRDSSTSTSTAPVRGPTSPSTPCNRWRPSSARKLPGSPSWSAACSTR